MRFILFDPRLEQLNWTLRHGKKRRRKTTRGRYVTRKKIVKEIEKVAFFKQSASLNQIFKGYHNRYKHCSRIMYLYLSDLLSALCVQIQNSD